MSYKQYFLIALIGYISCFIYYIDFSDEMPTLYYSGVEFLKYYGYEGEEHEFVSEDGFKSKIHRIGHGEKGRKVILIVPGIHCSSEVIFALGPEHDISYSLYDSGLDVWVTNFRGTNNTKPLENKTVTDDDLTNFSFHEQGYYDLASSIDLVIKVTGQKKITVAGVSMGTALITTLLATRPEYNTKIEKAIFFGAIGPFSAKTTLFQKICYKFITFNKAVTDYLTTSYKYRRPISHLICNHPLSPISCWKTIHSYLGYISEDLSNPESAVALNIMFTGPYMGIYEHLDQMGAAKHYVMRDFGKEKNLRKYGVEIPPPYNMSNIKVPIIIFDAIEDLFLPQEARIEMKKLIPNIRQIITVKSPFQHGNFMSNGAIDKRFVSDAIKAVHDQS